ncbi:MAG TPA: hypothetical protein DEF34_03375 [Desulfotomaculum sp.]|nr:MAG: hypothetical protein JL56_02985 [Desulfotomaculum sp. BICA1-6]HBX22669.1 hypothetical protein [Desulfotomaculum sp.]
MALITQKDVDDIKAAMAELAPFTEEPITYRTFTGMTAGDSVHGTPETPNYTDTNETAMTRNLTAEEVQKSGGYYIIGDMEFTIRRETEPQYEDRIVCGGLTWKPKKIDKTFLGEVLWWEVKARRE